jgi:hypothetical protein
MAKLGVAVQGAATIDVPEDVSGRPDADSRRAAEVIVQIMHALEADAVRARPDRWTAATAAERERTSVVLLELQRQSGVYYFEARKRYAGRDLDAFGTGWLAVSEHGSTILGTAFDVTDLDYKGVRRSDVLGVLRVAGRVVWLMEGHGYEDETYDLIEKGQVRLSVSGGGC